MKKEQGFSLVELLIVVAIIAIIAAIAVPSLLTSRMAANEAGAIESCRTIGSSEIAFSATNNQQYAAIADLVTDGFLDQRFTGTVNGYTFTEGNSITGLLADTPTAVPDGFGVMAVHGAGLGRYDFEIGPDQVVRYGTVAADNYAEGDPIGGTAGASGS
jgi:prepilin-type N-terminal cleavage/methylation domain-containing protein